MNSGIYKIVNTVNSKIYIGSAVDFQRRWALHLSLLRRGMHHNIKLQRAWNKYGESAFEFSILEHSPADHGLIDVEQKWLDTMTPFYNIAKIAGSQLGIKLRVETKQKMSIARVGKSASKETRAKMSAWQIGRTRPAETCQRISESKKAAGLKGRPAHNKGKTHSVETRAKMSAWHKANRGALA